MNEFQDKIAVITGAANGLGYRVAYEFAKKGIHIVMADVSNELESAFLRIKNEFPENKGLYIRVDVTKEQEMENLIDISVERLGRIDIMVNNAGIIHDATPVTDMPESIIDRVFSVNVNGVIFGSKYAARQMIKQGSGSIINMSSRSGKTGHENCSVYCASKGAVIVFTQALAAELASHNVRANCVCPGLMETEMQFKYVRDEAAIKDIPFEELNNRYISNVPLKRYGTGADVAGAILYLSSENGSYVTGQALNVNGGLEVH